MYEVLLSPDALRAYDRADSVLARKLNRCFALLAQEPHSHPRTRPLTGIHRGRWRFRLGDWRVIYTIDETSRRVFVLIIAHRREAYR
ncbi:MAG: type II toxin-antitoxin system RelE/ParE family toxin [Planctomycetes bacterium]|nr:type II toxin-antitoxin system RelE/ParE family toxin [Planctomycetota bacterium]